MKRWTIGVLGAGGFAVVMLGCSGTASATYPGSNGVIAYSPTHYQNDNLWIINPDGTGNKLLAHGASPAWSPDGRLLAYSSRWDFYPRTGIRVINSDGTNRRAVTHDRDIVTSFSPNGRRILFDRFNSVEGESLMSIRLDGSHRRIVIRYGRFGNSSFILGGTYSPNGRWIVYGRGGYGPDGDQSREYLIHPDGSGNHPITTAADNIALGGVDWTPDGNHLVYGVPGEQQLWIMNLHGSNRHLWINDIDVSNGFSISPDGQFVAFSPAPPGPPPLETIRTDGTDLRQLTDPSNGAAVSPAWQPLP